MKAVVLSGLGGPEMLSVQDVPDPVPGPGEILVDVHAASVNAADWKMRRAEARYAVSFPYILGRDFSGTVAALGPGVADFAPGDAVFGVADQGGDGCYAERLAIKAAIVARKPDALTHAQAAAMGLTSLTALWALEDTAKLQAGETVLVQGGAGGVAGFAIQLARHLGATVLTTASAANHDYARSLGAHRAIDYRTEDVAAAAGPCDVVFDTVGGSARDSSYAVLKPGGRLVWIAEAPKDYVIPRQDVRTLRPDVKRDRAHLERMKALLAAGAVWPPEIVTYAMDDVREAHRVSEARHLRGKLVLAIR